MRKRDTDKMEWSGVVVGKALNHIYVSYPASVHGLHGPKEQLKLLDGDAVAGQHSQHFNQ